MSDTLLATDCLDAHGDDVSECNGAVDYRPAMSPTGKWFPRCEKHYEARYETQRGIVSRYGGQMFYDGPEDDYATSWQDEAGDY